MGKAILIIGDMGTGKSTSLRNLPPDETVIISPNSKDLPWEGAMQDFSPQKGNFIVCTKIKKAKADDVKESLGVIEHLAAVNNNKKIKYVILEDLTHYMNDRMMDDKFTSSTDWGKWGRFGSDIFSITTKYMAMYREDLTAIIVGHTEVKDNGQVGMQTAGKLLDAAIRIPSYFTYVLHARVFNENGALSYKFQTHNDGKHLAKTPLGMFKENYVDNDLRAIIAKIDEYRNGLIKTPPAAPGTPVTL